MSDSPRQLRATLPILKAPIIEIGPDYFVIGLGANYGSPTRITVRPDNIAMYDLRVTDVLTIYTEVLFKKPAGAA